MQYVIFLKLDMCHQNLCHVMFRSNYDYLYYPCIPMSAQYHDRQLYKRAKAKYIFMSINTNIDLLELL